EGAQQQQAWQQQLERLRYQAHLAERQFQRADPDNRLVTAELERRWEAALRELKAAEGAWQRLAGGGGTEGLDAATRPGFAAQAGQIGRLWREQALTPARQKALLRCLIDKVVVRRAGGDAAEVRLVWRGGETSTLAVAVPAATWASLSRLGEIEAAIGRLAGA